MPAADPAYIAVWSRSKKAAINSCFRPDVAVVSWRHAIHTSHKTGSLLFQYLR
jgi:hypothetical protein